MNGNIIESLNISLQRAEQHIEDLIVMGGPVMWPLLAVSLVLWTLVLERYWYLLRVFPAYIENNLPVLRSRAALIIETAEVTFLLRCHLRLIKTLSGILPMLGLLGTVTGIVETFDLIRVFGSAEPRIVARGVSQALITTMAGLVLGLFGVAVGYDLTRRAGAGERRFRSQIGRYE